MKDVKSALRRITATDDEKYSVVGTVTSVDESARTCEVQPVNGDATLYGIRLQAEQDTDTGAVLIPKKGAFVIVSFLGKNTGYVSERSRVDKIVWTIGQQELTYTSDGLRLESATSDLKTEVGNLIGLISGLLTTLTTFTVGTAVGPSTGVMPPSLTDLVAAKVKLQGIETKINTILA
jgi:hypothetical protein